jgi:hypothetical protein
MNPKTNREREKNEKKEQSKVGDIEKRWIYLDETKSTRAREQKERKEQIVNTGRQTSFEIQNHSVYKVGNNILSNRLTCINKKVPLNILNLDIDPFKVICKNMLLKWKL